MTLIYLIAKAEEKCEGRKGETKEPVLQETCKKCFLDFLLNPVNYETGAIFLIKEALYEILR